MTDALQRFVNTLDEDVREMCEGKKDLGVLAILDHEGVDVPEDVLDEVERAAAEARNEDAIMEGMRVFLGSGVPDGAVIEP